ncbi:MAG: hypothetical protein H7A44_03595 [Opitutaceae bacterium]|nr:hypothetical protein [Cephaloticoccus sp.]MCP5529503.1 hypothetical protein [Opitutaceae bacterium]
MPTLLEQLAGGDLRTLGRSAEVAAQVLAQPELIDELFDGIASDDEVIMARASDALEKVAAARPDVLQPYKQELLERVAHIKHWVVRAHVCQLLPRLDQLTATERRRAIALIQTYFADRSSIVRACAVECLVHLSAPADFAKERTRVIALVNDCAAHGDTPALRARARKMQRLLARQAKIEHPAKGSGT